MATAHLILVYLLAGMFLTLIVFPGLPKDETPALKLAGYLVITFLWPLLLVYYWCRNIYQILEEGKKS